MELPLELRRALIFAALTGIVFMVCGLSFATIPWASITTVRLGSDGLELPLIAPGMYLVVLGTLGLTPAVVVRRSAHTSSIILKIYAAVSLFTFLVLAVGAFTLSRSLFLLVCLIGGICVVYGWLLLRGLASDAVKAFLARSLN